jgi:hypothetical protein
MRRRLVLLGACLPLVAGAQTVYRCGPAGNVYTQHPCADGREIDVSDPRTPAQAAEARAELRAQEQWARRAAQQRRAEEAAHPPALAGGIAPLPPPRARPDDRPASPGRKERRPRKPVKSSDDGGFVAMAPAERSSPRRSR